MNRPYGAVDVSANLKGAVPKTATQKILVALAEKGEIVQKTYGPFIHPFIGLVDDASEGKTTFFVANQGTLETVPPERLASLEAEVKAINEENAALAAEVKTLSNGIAISTHSGFITGQRRLLFHSSRTIQVKGQPHR